MPTIRQLPTGLINKIAAGEVIERPASVVKEMLENSIDAGATHIVVTVAGGGTDLIRISDNGCGIDVEQLELAVAPHATSKIESGDDLFDVRTLGFRGEALASIAEISHLTLRSRTSASDSGYELCVKGGEKEPIRPCAAPVGTTLEVRHLFFNTPVRRKFMKSSQTEMGHVVEAFTRIALAFPHVHLELNSNERTLHDLEPTDRWTERIRAFFGEEISESLIPIDQKDDKVSIRGFVTDPSVSRSNNRMQYLFLNGRYIRDRALQHALGEAYRGLLMVGRMPVCFLHVDLDPKTVDVNVHPTKVEVRFEDSGAIYSRLLHSLRHKFLSSDLVARVRAAPSPESPEPISTGNQSSSVSLPSDPATPSRPLELLQWAHGNPSFPTPPTPPFQPYPGLRDPFAGPPPSTAVPWSPDPSVTLVGTEHVAPTIELQDRSSDIRLDANHSHAPLQVGGFATPIGFQIHNRYLVAEDESGMVVVDQHALHERILYEQIKTKVLAKSLDRQRLLVPEPITMAPNEAAAAIEWKETLSEIGMEIEPFGGDTILITTYPAILSKMSPGEMLRQILEPLMAGGKRPDPRDMLDELMNMIACKAAIKAGDKLSSDEISSLLSQRDLYHDTHHCPHGRPTALFFSKEQLDKMFKRI